MLKKIILATITAFFMITSAYAAGSPDWVPVEGAYKTWLDRNSVSYNSGLGEITYWDKISAQTGVSFLKKHKVGLHDKTVVLTDEIKAGPGNTRVRVNTYSKKPIEIIPDSSVEKEVNKACDVLKLNPILGEKKHTWKFIKSVTAEVGPGMEYICLDTYDYNPETQVAHVYMKSVYENNRFVPYAVDVKLKEQVVERFPGMGRFVAPGTLEEAIYNATLDLIKK